MPPRPTSGRSRVAARVLISLICAVAIMIAWIAIEGRAMRRALPLDLLPEDFATASAISGATIAAILGVIAWRQPRLRSGIRFALVASVLALPWLHDEALYALSTVRVGGFGDYVWSVGPRDLYGMDRAPGARWLIWIAVVLVVAAALSRATRSPSLRWVLTTAMLGLAACVIGRGAVHRITRPPLDRWLEAIPEVTRIPLEAVAQRRLNATPTMLPGGIQLFRDDTNPFAPVRVSTWAPPFSNGRIELLSPDGSMLECDRGVTLVLRRIPETPWMLLSCGEMPASRWVSDGISSEASVVEVHDWEVKLRDYNVLEHAAPPRAWVAVAAIGLAVALGMLAVAHRRRRSADRAASFGPYRAPGDAPRLSEDLPLSALRHAAAIAIAVHAAAPLVLLEWIHVMMWIL